MAKLLTSGEDPGHFHAIVGLLNLIQYFLRFSLILGGDLDAGFARDLPLDIFSVCLMTLPSASSFLFSKHVPMENKGDNVTIWKEYRLHNAIVVAQPILLLSLKVYELHFHEIGKNLFYFKYGIMFFRGYLMAWVTTNFPPKNTTTIRGAYRDAPAFVPFFLSYAQYAAAAVLIYWPLNTAILLILIAGLQLNSFAMTLRKKGKIGTSTFLSFYGFMVGSLFVFGFMPPMMDPAPPTSVLDVRLKPLVIGLVTFMIRRQNIDRNICWIVGPPLTETGYHLLNKVLDNQTQVV